MDMKENIDIKKLEIEPEEKGFTGWVKSKQFRKTLIAIMIGAVTGFAYFYFTEGKHMEVVSSGDVIQDVIFGAFLGFFVTNSPCSRNKC